MAEVGPGMSVDGASPSSTMSETPQGRIPMRERLKLLRDRQARSRTSASPHPTPPRPAPDIAQTVISNQDSSSQVSPGSLPAASRLVDVSARTSSRASSPRDQPRSAPSSRTVSETGRNDVSVLTRASPPPVQSNKLAGNEPPEPIPANAHQGLVNESSAPNGLSPDPASAPILPPQPSMVPQPTVFVNSDQQTRFIAPPMPIPIEVPHVYAAPHNNQQLPVRPNYVPFPPSSQPPRNSSLTVYKQTPNEHFVSLAMNGRVRAQYLQYISMFQGHILELMHSENPTEECFKGVEKLLYQVDKVTNHTDLTTAQDPDNFSQTLPQQEAEFAEDCSFKFQFLHHFLEQIRYSDLHISIVAQPGKLLDIIETYMIGRGIAYFRPDGKGASSPNDPRFTNCRCQVSIVPSCPEGMTLAVKPAAVVIAFDGSVRVESPQVYRMRLREGDDQLSPVAHLLIYNSSEHIARCLPPQMDPLERLKKIVSCMTQVRREVGILDPRDSPVDFAGQEVGISVASGGYETRWVLPDIRPISLSFLDSSRDSSTQEDSQSAASQDTNIQSSALKRAWVGRSFTAARIEES
ncbi:MAG: hypothetical protein Q9174_003121 [Haloplaca sp. 1 TL-2023]